MKTFTKIIYILIFYNNILCKLKDIEDKNDKQQVNESIYQSVENKNQPNQEIDLNKININSEEDELDSTKHVQPQDAIYNNSSSQIENQSSIQNNEINQVDKKLNQKDNVVGKGQVDQKKQFVYETPNGQEKIDQQKQNVYETPNGQNQNQKVKQKLSPEEQNQRLRNRMFQEDNYVQKKPQVQIPDCQFNNVIITLGDIFYTSESIGDSQLKVSFVSQYKCKKIPALIIKINHQEFTFKFELYDIYVTKIFALNEKDNSKFYIRYSYIALIKNIGELIEFNYHLVKDISQPDIISKSFKYKSNVLQANKTGNLKFITYGDQPFDDRGKFLFKQIEKEDFDMLILLGDLGYDLQDNYGKKGDEYFDMIESISATKPVQFINGNHDMEDLGRILNFRVLQPGCINKDQNNFYTFELANTDFYFYNTDFYINYSSQQQSQRVIKIGKEHSQHDNKLKFLFTHRTLNCFNYKNKEKCYKEGDYYFKQYRKYLKDIEIDIHFAGHVHMYQRFEQKKIENILKTGENQEGYRIGQMTIINGAGGQIENQQNFNKESIRKIEGLEYHPNQQGYVVVEIKNFDQVSSQFYSIEDMFNNVDNQSKVLDSFEYYRIKSYLNRRILL